tara:strand:+ start:1332 stop:1781 length:450 start_codon:yes stop_codon:yes gene_type:complete
MKQVVLILIFFISSCGYQPIYVKKNAEILEYSSISLIGDAEINRKIINSLNIKETNFNSLKRELVLNSSFKVDETSKNSKGQVVSYRSTARVELKILENKELQIGKIIIRDFTYGNRDNKFDLVEYQNEVKNNLINEVIEDINLFINLK